MIALLLALLLALALALLLLRTSPPSPSPPPPPLPLPLPPAPQAPPLPPRHVSFSLASIDTSYSLPLPPSPYRRWSSPFHKRRPSTADSPRTPQLQPVPVDQFGRLPVSFDTHPSPKLVGRLPTPLRLLDNGKRRSSSVSSASTSIPPDQVDTRTPSPPHASSPFQRTRFANPFRKHARSRTLSPPSTQSFETCSSTPSTMSSPPVRRSLVSKLKSVFKPVPPEPSPILHSKPLTMTINNRLRRKPVLRTQPYGPPWNAPMPVPDFSLSQHFIQKHVETVSPSPQTSRKCSVHEPSLPQEPLMLPGQLSPRTFINELDEKLSLLQQQRTQDPIPSPHE